MIALAAALLAAAPCAGPWPLWERYVQSFVAGDGRVFGVIKMRASHPTIDQHRFGDGGNERGLRLHFVTKGASSEFRARCRIEALSCLIWINSKENRTLECFYIVILRAVSFLIGSKLTEKTFHLLGCELIDLSFVCYVGLPPG